MAVLVLVLTGLAAFDFAQAREAGHYVLRPASARSEAPRAQAPDKPNAPTDAQIKAEVERRLAELRPRPALKVTVADATVTLTGTLPNAWAKHEVIDAARQAPGLKFVVSEIEIPRAETDAVLALEVGQELLRSSVYTVYDDVTGGVRNGVVTLRGRVISPAGVERLGELAARIRGVQAVNNEIREMPPSQSDDRLRYDIAYGIYGDPMFLNLSMTLTPPIHVVVENGRVTLVGRVHTKNEKDRADLIAKLRAGASRVESKLQVDR